jgi:NAD+ synthase
MSSRSPDGSAEHDGDLAIDPEWTTKTLTEFIHNEVLRTGRERVVIGLSGGIDSAVVAYLAVRALGPASVRCVSMPYRTSHGDSLRDSRSVADELGVTCEEVDLTAMVDGFTRVTGDVNRLRLGNVMARARMILLFDRSAQHDALVLGTSNKTELLLGYGTLHGDLAAALDPLGDLYKTQVRELARHLGVPAAIQQKPPSADLWPDQSDEADFGFSYEEVDRLLALLVDARVSRERAVETGFDREMVDRVIRLVVRSQFKRQLPLIAKLSARSVGWDFRYPREWLS